MKKPNLFSIAVSVSALTLALGVILTSNIENRIISADPAPLNTLTINQDTDFSDNTFTVTSAAENTFHFEAYFLTKGDGVYEMNKAERSTVYNREALNGISRVVINGSTKGIRYSAKTDENGSWTTESVAYVNDQGVYDIDLSVLKPSFFRITCNNDTFNFSSMTIYYSCVNDTEVRNVSSMVNLPVDGIQSNKTKMYNKTGNSINDFNFYKSAFSVGTLYYTIESNSQLSNVTIKYNEDELKDTNTVVSGAHSATVEFTFENRDYRCENVIIDGYRDIFKTIEGINLCDNNYRLSNNQMPDNFGDFLAEYSFVITDVNGDYLDGGDGNKYSDFSLAENVSYGDENPYTTGEHTIGFEFSGKSLNSSYNIYNPEVNKVKEISFDGTEIIVPHKSTVDEFYEIAKNERVTIEYYEDHPSYVHNLPITRELTTVSESLFNEVDSKYIEVTYLNASLLVTVNVEARPGNLVTTYTLGSGDKIYHPIYASSQITEIEVYDNDCVILRYETSGSGHFDYDYHSYETNSNVMTICIKNGIHLRVVIDENLKLFYKYEHTGALYNLMANFDLLTGEDNGYSMPMVIYEDGALTFDPTGSGVQIIECAYQVDPDNELHIYFNVSAKGNVYTCEGDIDTVNNQFLLTEVHQQ